jgi:uncharacterized membrane protein
MITATTITFYSVVLFVHVMAVVVGFGVTYAYAIFWGVARKRHPRSLPYLFEVQERLGSGLIGPSAGLILLTGIYMAATEDGGYGFDASFVKVGLPIVLALIILGPTFFGPTEAKLSEMARRDVAATSEGGEVTFGDDFERAYRRLINVSRVSALLIAVAVFYMVVKP